MPARIVGCRTPGCGGRAEYLQTKRVYRCDDCGGRFEPHEVPSEPLRDGVTSFHGRLAERAVLEGTLEAAAGGRCQVALIHGPPGIGKTALMRAIYHELASADRDPADYWPDVVGELAELSRDYPRLRSLRLGLELPFLWLAGYSPAPASSSTQPLYPWQKALEGLRNLPLAPSSASRATGVARAAGRGLLDLGAGLLGIGLLKTLLETSVGVGRALTRSSSDVTGIEEVGSSVTRAMERDVVTVVTKLATHPDVPILVISLDDLQWADDATAAAIVAVCRQAGPGSRLLLLLGYRDTEVASGGSALGSVLPTLHRYAGESSFDLVDVPLGELDAASATALVRGYFTDAADDLKGWLTDEIGGTPFYLHQFCTLLLERGDVNPHGVVRTPGGVHTLRHAVRDGHLPVRLEAVLRERLDRLEVRQRQLLAIGSVEGRTFTDGFLEHALRRSEPTGPTSPDARRDAIRRDLDDCERLHRLIRSALSTSTGNWPFEFMHELLHVASGQQLSPALRATCLSALSEWLLDTWREPTFATYPLTEQRRVLDRLVSLIPMHRRTELGMTDSEYVRLMLDAAQVFRTTGSLEAAIDTLNPAMAALRAGDLDVDDTMTGTYFDQASDLFAAAHRWTDAVTALHLALEFHERRARVGSDQDALDGLIGTRQRQGDLRLRHGDLPAAEASYMAAIETLSQYPALAAEPRMLRTASLTHGRLGDVHARRGALGAAEKEYRSSLRIHERLVQTSSDVDLHQELAIAHCDLGDLLIRRGELDAAENHYNLALEIRKNHTPADGIDVEAVAYLSGNLTRLADLAVRRGDLAEAESLLRQDLEFGERLVADREDLEATRMLGVTITKLADVVLRRGDLEGAERLYRRDLALSENLAAFAPYAETERALSVALLSLGRLLERRGQLDEAESLFRRNLTLCETLAHDEQDGETQLNLSNGLADLGRLLERRGQLDEAESLFRRNLALTESLPADELDIASGSHLSAALASLGRLLERRGQLDEAETLYRRDLTLSERLAHDETDGDTQRNLSGALSNLGGLLERRGQLHDAEYHYRRDLTLSEVLAHDETDSDNQRNLSIALSNLGQVLERQGKLDEAETLYRRDLTLSGRLARDESDDVAQRDLSCSHLNLGDLAFRRGDLRSAMAQYGRAFDLRERLAQDQLDTDAQVDLIACLHRMHLATRRQSEQPSDSTWQQQERAIRTRLPASGKDALLDELERCARLVADTTPAGDGHA